MKAIAHMSLVMKASGLNSVQAEDWSGFENQLWSRTWDNCLENKATGKVGHENWTKYYPAVKVTSGAGI